MVRLATRWRTWVPARLAAIGYVAFVMLTATAEQLLVTSRYRGSQPRYDLIIEPGVEMPMRDAGAVHTMYAGGSKAPYLTLLIIRP